MATPTQQYIQLMTKRYHLCLKRLSRTEEVDDRPLEQIQELEHPEFMARFGPSRQADGICDRDRCSTGPPREASATATIRQDGAVTWTSSCRRAARWRASNTTRRCPMRRCRPSWPCCGSRMAS